MKIQLFKKENSFKKKDFVFNPNFYWEMAIGIGAVATILSCVFGYYLFMRINEEPVMSDTAGGSQVPTVKKDRMEKVLNLFSDRENKSADILHSPSPVVDPSR